MQMCTGIMLLDLLMTVVPVNTLFQMNRAIETYTGLYRYTEHFCLFPRLLHLQSQLMILLLLCQKSYGPGGVKGGCTC